MLSMKKHAKLEDCFTAKPEDRLNAKLEDCFTAKLEDCFTAKLEDRFTSKLVNRLTATRLLDRLTAKLMDSYARGQLRSWTATLVDRLTAKFKSCLTAKQVNIKPVVPSRKNTANKLLPNFRTMKCQTKHPIKQTPWPNAGTNVPPRLCPKLRRNSDYTRARHSRRQRRKNTV